MVQASSLKEGPIHDCSRKHGPFPHQKDNKLALFCDQHTCGEGCNHCGDGVILDQFYFLTNGMSKSCRGLVGAIFYRDCNFSLWVNFDSKF